MEWLPPNTRVTVGLLREAIISASARPDETQLHRLFSLQYGPCVLHLLSDVEHQLFYLVFCDIRVELGLINEIGGMSEAFAKLQELVQNTSEN